tara:strand:+ start:170 stop:1168 length:999 start_codon:yes stop_codon:yes gene_type:complete
MVKGYKLIIPVIAALTQLLTGCATLKPISQPKIIYKHTFLNMNGVNTSEIVEQKYLQYRIDKREGQDSDIEKLIEKEFKINLFLPEDYPEDKLQFFRRNLVTTKDINSDLVASVAGKDIIILPKSVKKGKESYDGAYCGSYIELFSTSVLVISHEFDHAFCDNYFPIILQKKVESLGYSFSDIIKVGSGQKVKWQNKTGKAAYGHNGIFPKSYASKLDPRGVAVEYSAVLREYVHTAKPFYVDNDKDAKAYEEIFEFMFENQKFSEVERSNAIKLIKKVPTYSGHTVEKGETLRDIGVKHNLFWTEVYNANSDQIKDPDKLSPGQELKIRTN